MHPRTECLRTETVRLSVVGQSSGAYVDTYSLTICAAVLGRDLIAEMPIAGAGTTLLDEEQCISQT